MAGFEWAEASGYEDERIKEISRLLHSLSVPSQQRPLLHFHFTSRFFLSQRLSGLCQLEVKT